MRLLLLLLCGLTVAGCSRQPTASPARTVSMQIGTRAFTLEVADTDALRETGLMNRDSMPDDHGMIFVFSHRLFPRFWMKDTRIPLDILFVDRDGTVITIRTMKPYDQTLIAPAAPVLYAIELNAGAARRAGVREGQALRIPAEIASLP